MKAAAEKELISSKKYYTSLNLLITDVDDSQAGQKKMNDAWKVVFKQAVNYKSEPWKKQVNDAKATLKDQKKRNAYTARLQKYKLRDGLQIDPDFAAKIARGENPADTFDNEGAGGLEPKQEDRLPEEIENFDPLPEEIEDVDLEPEQIEDVDLEPVLPKKVTPKPKAVKKVDEEAQATKIKPQPEGK